LASPKVCGQVRKLAEKMSPTACQGLVGCATGCLEMVKGKDLNPKDCRDFDECLGDCRANAKKEPIKFKAARTGKTVAARCPPKGSGSPLIGLSMKYLQEAKA
jgi:hypothetical protein